MTEALPRIPFFEFEAFGVAVGASVVCGALSILLPTFLAPTATLAALAVAGWVSLARRRGELTRSGFGRGRVAALAVLGVGAAGFFVTPALLENLRGPLLAGGLVPLFLTERTRSMGRFPVFSRT